jgi:hypothetical protein
MLARVRSHDAGREVDALVCQCGAHHRASGIVAEGADVRAPEPPPPQRHQSRRHLAARLAVVGDQLLLRIEAGMALHDAQMIDAAETEAQHVEAFVAREPIRGQPAPRLAGCHYDFSTTWPENGT